MLSDMLVCGYIVFHETSICGFVFNVCVWFLCSMFVCGFCVFHDTSMWVSLPAYVVFALCEFNLHFSYGHV